MTLAKVFSIASEEWDLYLDSLEADTCPVANLLKQELFYIRLRNKKSYHLFCEATQKMDCFQCLPLNFSLDPVKAISAIIYTTLRRALALEIVTGYEEDK